MLKLLNMLHCDYKRAGISYYNLSSMMHLPFNMHRKNTKMTNKSF